MSARVSVRRRGIRTLRLDAGVTRWVVTAMAIVGVASCVRFAIVPPRPHIPAPPAVQRIDLGATAYAEAFARAYLTFDARRPDLHAAQLQPFLNAEQDPDAGFSPPHQGSQSVAWASVVQSRPADGADGAGTTYTVAAQTSRPATVYLTVTVRRTASKALQVVGLPAFVGAPAQERSPAVDGDRLDEVVESDITEVVARGLRNYLAGDSTDLRADLARDAVVSVPTDSLRLQRVDRVVWAPGGRSVFATVTATARDGGLFQLTYELDIARSDARPYIAAIQMDPRS
jgi:hypothetical protein